MTAIVIPTNAASAILGASPSTPRAASSRIKTTRKTTIVPLSYGRAREGADAGHQLTRMLQRKVMDALHPRDLGGCARRTKRFDALVFASVPPRVVARGEDRQRRHAQPRVHRDGVLLP